MACAIPSGDGKVANLFLQCNALRMGSVGLTHPAEEPFSLECRPQQAVVRLSNINWMGARKIRLIESNTKCRHLKILICKGTLRQMFYLSEAPSPSMTPYSPPLTHCIRIYQYTYLHREGGGRAITREKVRGAIVHKAGPNTIDRISSL